MHTRTWLLTTALAFGACVPPLVLPDEGLFACDDNADCPPGAACAVTQQLCVPDTGPCVVDGDVVDDGGGCALPGSTEAICLAGVCREPTCGDGVVSGSEACDRGSNNSDAAADACRLNCVVPSCGDDVIDSGESCDVDVDAAGAACDACVLLCEPGAGNCNVDGSDGCECDVVGFAGAYQQVAFNGADVVAVRSTVDGFELVDVDPAAGTTNVVQRFVDPNNFFEELFAVDGRVLGVRQAEVVSFEIDRLRVLYAAPDSETFGLCVGGSRIYVRTDEAIVGFDAADGANEAVVAVPEREDPDRASISSIACVSDNVVWVQRGDVVRAAADGTQRDAPPNVVVTGEDRFIVGLFADGSDVLVVDPRNIERVTSTTTTVLARLPVGFSFDTFTPRVAVAGAKILFSAEHDFGRSGVFSIPTSGGTPTMLTTSSGEFAADGDVLIVVALADGLASLRLAP